MKEDRLIYTLDNCVGCNKCIKFCPALGVNRSVRGESGNRIEVDGSKCIHCGNCFKACEHEARAFEDGWDEILEALNAGEKVVLMVAPSFFLNYSEDIPHYIAFFKSLGFSAVYDVSFGANITTWASVKYTKETGRTGLISSACPVVVDYIEKYKPSLLSRLMPIMSPVGALQTYLRAKVYPKNDVKYAFLCPCVGKHDEYTTYPDGYLLDYTVTFKTLFEYIAKNEIKIQSAGRAQCDEMGFSGTGVFYPVPGGLRNNIRCFVGTNEFIKQVEGPSRLYPYLDTLEKMLKNGDTVPFLIDALNCEGGCAEGVASNRSVEDAELLMTRLQSMAKDLVGASPYTGDAPQVVSDRWIEFDDYMSGKLELDYKDYMRRFNDKAAVPEAVVPEAAINEIFLSMKKETENDRKINCTSCGYKGCREMAKAIYLGLNKPENCVHYVNRELEENKKQLEEVLVALSGGRGKEGLSLVKTEQIVQMIKDSVLEVENEREILNNSFHARNQMFANLTHELRTPLNAVMNMAGLMDKNGLTREQLENVNAIEVAGKGLLDTINEILDFSKIEAGQFSIVEDEYYLHELLGELITVMTFRCMEKNLQLVRELDLTTPDLLIGDVKRNRQVAINMIGNAVKYTKTGSVTIKCGWNHDMDNPVIRFSVKDTGIGIKEEDLPYIFDSYKQVNEKETKHIVGTGLGLSICKSIADAMNGEVRVESEYGVGSTFFFDVPQKMKEYKPIGDIMPKKDEEKKKQFTFRIPTLKVLVVDDLSINLHIARTFLDKYQIFAETAESGDEAVERCMKKKYDLIFMDRLMPGMDGNETVRAIRTSNGQSTETPIISMSADGSELIKTGPGELFMAIITKPIQRDMLEEALLKSVPTDMVLYDEKGFIPMAQELRTAAEKRDASTLLMLISGMETYAASVNEERVHKLARKFRLVLQQGNVDMPINNIEVIIAQCNILSAIKP